jgi:hypothetical protein
MFRKKEVVETAIITEFRNQAPMKQPRMRMVLGIAFVWTISSTLTRAAQTEGSTTKDAPQSVCSVVLNPERYENKPVVVESTVVAGGHATVLEGPECGKGIYLSHEYGRPGERWRSLDAAIAAKGSGLDRRVLHVRVRGIYHSALPFRKGTIRQLEVIEVLEVAFQDVGRH